MRNAGWAFVAIVRSSRGRERNRKGVKDFWRLGFFFFQKRFVSEIIFQNENYT